MAVAAETPAQNIVHDAFISYSRRDKVFAVQLEKALEAYRPPKDLQAPQRYLDVFRDEEDFSGTEYHQSLDKHLKQSRKLIVVCTPNARRSAYVNDEIRRFAEYNSTENIIPVLLSGVPNNEATPEREAEMAFPDALCAVMPIPLAASYLGFTTDKKTKVSAGPFEGAWYTVLANLFDKSRSEIEQREKKRESARRRIRNGIVG